LSEVVPSPSVQEEDVKISALSSHSRDKSMTMRMLIPGGTAPLLKTLELSNYKRNSSLIEMESVHANCSTSPITERSEALMAKPEEETRNTEMPNQCITAGSLGHSTSSVCCGNELFSTSALCQSFPCGLIHESLTEKKQESLLPLPKSYEAVLQGDKNVVWGKTDPLISLPERDLESCKKAEVVFIPRRPGSISEHHEMELCCKSAELHTPFGIFASNVAQVVSVASTTSSEGFSARVEGYSLILNKINFQGKNENKFTVVDSVKGSICYNEAPTSGQSLQGAQTDKPRSCSSALGSPTQKRKSRKARNERRCSGGISMLSSDSSDNEVFQAGRALRASSPVLIKKQRRKRRSPVEQLLKDYLHQVSSSDVDIDGLESPQLAELKSPTL